MFKLMLQGSGQSKVIECTSIEESRTMFTKALTEKFLAIKGGIVYECHWRTWKLFRDHEINPLSGCFSPKEDIVYVMPYYEFVKVVATDGYGLWRNDEKGMDVISFGRTGDKCFATHMSQNFNEYVPWNIAYQMYTDFLGGIG